jgi:NADH-quinone oxidoreductase subunit G
MSEQTIKLKINNIEVEVPKGINVLEAAKSAKINIPRLCYHPDLDPTAACGLCLIKFRDRGDQMVRACVTEAQEGMDIITNDSDLYRVRRTVLELILSNHPDDCLKCSRNMNCELQTLAGNFGIRESVIPNINVPLKQDRSTPSLILDPEKCVLCGRCVDVCQNKQNVNALEFIGRGFEMKIAPAGDIKLNDSPCIKCGQCSAHCPVGAIVENSHSEKVWGAFNNPDLYPVVQMAPAVRVAFGEAFGIESGEIVTKKLYTLFRMLGFKAVFDTNFSADLTIMEEGSEFVHLFTNNPEKLPLITSCCPSWVDYLEKFYPDLIDHFSTAKSPQEMMGALAKTYFAKEKNIEPSKIYSVSVMPCTAKKYELSRVREMNQSDFQCVDSSITTRELVRMCRSAGIDFNALEEGEADSILGNYTGAGTLFGATGGVMEAALRSAYYLITKENLPNVELTSVRGLEGVKEAVVDIKGTKVKVAVAHGIKNVEYIMDKLLEAKEKGEPMPYHFIEVMACEGGCISGGGQPYGITQELRKKRSEGLYKDDKNMKQRCSHDNPEIKAVYDKFLGHPGSEKAHELLHTHYKGRHLYRK